MTALLILVLVSALAISHMATWRVNRTNLRSSKVPVSSGLSGDEVGAQILECAGVADVGLAEHDELLGDHSDPLLTWRRD